MIPVRSMKRVYLLFPDLEERIRWLFDELERLNSSLESGSFHRLVRLVDQKWKKVIRVGAKTMVDLGDGPRLEVRWWSEPI
jgi:hypothetical protein